MISILFIDDEPKLLEGLRRMMHCLSKELHLEFVLGGAQALERMGEHRFDVVVSDMRMPGMDGSQLLQEIMVRFPTTVRIVLSGQCDRDTILKAVLPAHQFLTKPCNSNVLQATIEQTCRLQYMVSDERLRSKVSCVTSLPSTSSAYQELCLNINANNAAIGQIAKTIAMDVGASTKVLQLISSGFFGMPQKLVSPDHAVLSLGLKTIQALAASPHVFRTAPTQALDAICTWVTAHSLEVAKCAKKIAAAETGDSEASIQAYVAGMLHDVGNLVLMEETEDPGEVEKCWDAERQHQTTGHAAIGGYLLGLWGLPEAIVNAATFHHSPILSADKTFTALTAVHAADFIVGENTFEESSNQRSPDREYLERIGCIDRFDSWRELDFTKEKAEALP
jgi:HD-like signal output (HDOD) protein